MIPPEYQSAWHRHKRDVSRGTQKYETHPEEYPVNRPIVNLSAFKKATGEIKYTHDMPVPVRGLHAAFVTGVRSDVTFEYSDSDTGKKLEVNDLIAALQKRFSGLVDYITADNFPEDCRNLQAPLSLDDSEPLFCEDKTVESFGQAMGLVLAETEAIALKTARFIQTNCISYQSNGSKPVLSIEESLKRSRYRDHRVNNKHKIIERDGSTFEWVSDNSRAKLDGYECEVVQGRQRTGSQIHFYAETQSCVAERGEDNNIIIYSSTQSPFLVQTRISHTLNIKSHNINVIVKRIGGGFGGKTDRSAFIAAAVSVASWKHRRLVKLAMPRAEDTAMSGKRAGFLGEFHMAVATGPDPEKDKGKVVGIDARLFSDVGSHYGQAPFVMGGAQLRGDTAYMIKNYRTKGVLCKTNKATTTAFRSYGQVQACLIMEEAIEKSAHAIGMQPEEVRQKNLLKLGDFTPWGQKLNYCYMEQVWDRLINTCDFWGRHKEIQEFNKNNRWKKRGICAMPLKYGMGFAAASEAQGGALIDIYQADGSVLIHQGGVEMGQGLKTIMVQIAAEALGIPISYVRIGNTDSNIIANPTSTEASSGGTYNGGALRKAGLLLRKRLEDFCDTCRQWNGLKWCREQGLNYWDYPKEGWNAIVTRAGESKETRIWENIITQAYLHRVDLAAHALWRDKGVVEFEMTNEQFAGFVYSAACSEVEIDVLTGETSVLRSDIVYDMGKSLNPAIDVGQVEGAFVMGIGFVLTEEVLFDNMGRLKTTNTWHYKQPDSNTIPEIFNVDLFPKAEASDAPENPYLLRGAKEVGEPPLVLAGSVFFAVKHAIMSARKDQGCDEWFEMESPATVNRVREACKVDTRNLEI